MNAFVGVPVFTSIVSFSRRDTRQIGDHPPTRYVSSINKVPNDAPSFASTTKVEISKSIFHGNHAGRQKEAFK